jgi:prepilin-type N-terminal cleavage/methylation domain-containing protein/prepilin-type processing-associated H-X9-DG protein
MKRSRKKSLTHIVVLAAGVATENRMRRAVPAGFSLVEVLVVLVIIGILAGMLLPAVQSARESARRSACGNNLRQSALAVLAYESARRTLPPGSDQVPRSGLPQGTQIAWSSFVLPYVEEAALASRIDYAKLWNAPGDNEASSDTWISTYVCPSGRMRTIGESDFGGVSGHVIAVDGEFIGAVGITNGLLVPVDASRPSAVRTAEATDGLGQTLMVAESVDRCDPATAAEIGFTYGRWAWVNHFAQSTPFINMPGSDIHSHHIGGANVAFGDGRVTLLGDGTDPAVLAGLCTRNGGETSAVAVAMQ